MNLASKKEKIIHTIQEINDVALLDQITQFIQEKQRSEELLKLYATPIQESLSLEALKEAQQYQPQEAKQSAGQWPGEESIEELLALLD